MEKDNKFTRMLSESDELLSSSDAKKASREQKREEARARKLAIKEEKERQKRIKKFGLVETREWPDESSLEASEESVPSEAQPAAPVTNEDQATEAAQEPIPQVKEPEAVQEAEIAEASGAQEIEETPETTQENQVTPEPKEVETEEETDPQETAAGEEAEKEEPSSEAQSGEASEASQETRQPEAQEPVNLLAREGEDEHTYREKEEIDEKLASNPKLSRVNEDEIARLKREIALERGIISPEDVAAANESKEKEKESEKKEIEEKAAEVEAPAQENDQAAAETSDEKNAKSAENDDKTASKQPNEQKNESEESKDKKDDKGKDKDKEKDKDKDQDATGEVPEFNTKNTKHETFNPPAVSQPDNITNEDIQQIMAEREEEERQNELKEEEEAYKGMTEEEIADAKERRRRFAELKQRYNAKEAQNSSDVGDYKKNLDFSVNTSIKQFRVKPPKKPFIITALVLALVMIVAGVVAYFIVNAPAAPIVLKSIALSQEYTNQRVDQKVDFTGVYIIKTYSNDSTQQVDITYDMVVEKSENIDENFMITSFLNPTYVTLALEGQTVQLKISVTDIVPQELSVSLPSDQYRMNDTIRYEDILMLVKVKIGTGSIFEEGEYRFDAASATATVSGRAVSKSASGFVISNDVFSTGENNVEFKITYRGLEFRCIVKVNLLP